MDSPRSVMVVTDNEPEYSAKLFANNKEKVFGNDQFCNLRGVLARDLISDHFSPAGTGGCVRTLCCLCFGFVKINFEQGNTRLANIRSGKQ
ncbi:uncharacterized protein LOC110818623 isoform X5 [Carica papaya]|uniref:uncharacterized protein LOC110818623 isoform X5 n=1 Tax=Carica papaya TaxID=3649 RepID=UPI000B8CAA3A|nr:uncharacterized protein LOC110818623 isoform X5 [Carica papaya]